LSALSTLVDQGKVVQCSLRDITARKLAEAERKCLLAAIEQTSDGIVMTDAQGNIEFVNPAYEQATGYRRQELLGQNPRILNSGRQDDLFYRQLWDTVSGCGTWKGRIVNKRKDGTLYTGETTISPVCDTSGRIVNFVAVQRDITEHLQLAAHNQQAQKMEAVGFLADGIAHEYNNILSVIIGYTELALEKVPPAQSLHADLEVILKAAQRSADVTRQLLAFARQQMIIPEVFDLNQCVENMLPMLRQFIGDAVQLAWRPTGDQLRIRMDPIQIGQILTNLCTNARDAITGAGKIILETDKAILDETFCAHHARHPADEYVLLAVSDDGCGMEKELLDKIFEPFFTNKRVGQGTGLGLSMVHGIVQQNNGFINVSSEPGTGTTFRIYLPRHIGHTDMPPEENPTAIPLGRGEMILVVDDELYLLTIAKRMLEKLGYRALTAGTPGEAIILTEAHSTKIRLLIADIIMPEMNGRNLAERLLSLCPSMKILFMSGYTANMIIDQGI
jgi:two-component system, cell cycle sensor histidine kinase and response regulator CckA